MSVPKKRKSKSAKKRGTLNVYPKKKLLVNCSKCKKPKLPHIACEFCGAYKGRQVVEQKVQKTLKAKKEKKEKEVDETGEGQKEESKK